MSKFTFHGIAFESFTDNELKEESLTLVKDGEVCEYSLHLDFGKNVYPSRYSLAWEEDQIDMMGFWSSKSQFSKNITPDWNMRSEVSRTATGMPLICIYSKANMNRITVALSDPANTTILSAGTVEENGRVRIKMELFPDISPLMSEYSITLRIDKRSIPLCDSVKSAREWWSELGYTVCHTPEYARLPMYSAWYSYHQEIDVDAIVRECKVAKSLGMDTVIVDDGWQTEDNTRGYAYCGDWKISKKKIPDMKNFVDRIHALGMKFVIWFSVPFVGYMSENYERFKGMYLRHRDNTKASVLDPRFKEVRDFLVDIYCGYVEEYGWDGLKLDFIDSFLPEDCSSKDYDKMDCVSVEEGVNKLLSEVSSRLKAINPEFMIEFRQSYVGPVVAKYGNFFRVTDCPCDPLANRIGAVDLRLTMGGAAVHSDMLMWNNNDTPESVAYQLLACMFTVPQISVRFDNITNEHKRLLEHFLSFWREHRDAILDGNISARDAEANYSMVKSQNDRESVVVLYQSVVVEADKKLVNYIFNSTGAAGIYVETEKKVKYEIYSIYGEKQCEGEIPVGVSKLSVDNCGMVKII
ncbi:MAG: alpha-galactosidase [Clostridia bacterium]|nr:alpha-galactosidase [Clostridia bacterium]